MVSPWEVAFKNSIAIAFESLRQTGRGIQRRNRVGRFVGWTTDDHAIENRTQCIHIPSRVGYRVEIGLLGSHVEKRAERWGLFVGQTALPKVSQTRQPVLIQQHVGRLEIAMQYPFSMRVI